MDTFGPVQPHTDNGPFRIWVMGPYVQPETITSSVNPKMLVYQISTAYFLGSMKTLFYLWVPNLYIYIYIYIKREREREREREMETHVQ